MTPFNYFFQMGAGIFMGIAIITLPSLWIYQKWIKGAGGTSLAEKTTRYFTHRGKSRDLGEGRSVR